MHARSEPSPNGRAPNDECECARVVVIVVVITAGMPTTSEGTEEVVRAFGYPRETFYGAMWDTAPKAEGEVNDTAYTNEALHPHV